jgi:ABC-type multidrug transport system ATPase subunit/ABC-type multidrug transport system permease subunit
MATFQNDTQSEKEVSSIPCSSQASIDIVTPVTSSRQGRPSYMRSIIQKRHSELRFVLGEHYDEEALIADEAPDFEDPAEPITNDPRLEGEFDPDDSPRRRRQMLHRVSVQAVTDPKQLVQVKIKDLCYFVPVQTDVPTKQTVLNQSLCYFTYEFFARLRNLACRPHDEVQRKYVARQASDLFLPYTKKPILQNVNLIFQPGKTYLVLGPPQSGKTTLLKAISGRLPHTVDLHGEPIKSKPHRSGRIEYNGIAIEDDSRLVLPNVVSFVGQLDVHAPYLTVKETFDFAFRSRNGDPTEASPCKVPSPDGTKTENLTIAGLGLGHVQDTFVGNSEVRGVSGGQRRRVTIGEMMQGDTPVACADEISTGLDAAVTYDICKSIVDFSKAAKTTRVVSLLQPGPETFALFDEVIVLSEGNCVYAGPISDVIGYFDSLGYALPATVDAADFLQSVTTPDGALLFDPDRSSYTQHLNSEQFATAFASSDHGKRIESLLENPSPHDWLLAKGNDIETTGGTHPKVSGVHTNIPERFRNSFQNSWIRSFQLNFNRHLLLWWRDKGFIIGKTFENMGMAVATGGILFGQANLPRDLRNGFISGEADAQALQEVVDGVFSALFMTCLHILLGTTTSTPDDIDGRPIHYKHADANFYQTAAFAIGRTISTLPQRAIEIVAFGIPVYWMVGLDASAKSFFIYLAVVLSYTFTLKIMYGIIAQILPNKQNVLSFGTFLVLVFSLFGGFIVYPTEIPWYFTWIRYLNPMAWALQAVLINEFTSQKYPDDISLSVLRSRGFETSRDWIGYTFVFLFGYVVFWNALLALVLRVVRIEPKKAGSPMPLSQESQPKILEDFNLPFTPVDLAFEDVTYEVKPSTGDGSLRLLNKVNGIFRSGRLVALMGSSGAGTLAPI